MKFQRNLLLNLLLLALAKAAVLSTIPEKIGEVLDATKQKVSELIPQSRILGGDQVIETDGPLVKYPFMVSLQKDGIHRCGGTLLTRKLILTAGHCSDTANEWYAKVNVNDLKVKDKVGGPQTKKILEVNRHPNYDANTETNDLSIWVVSDEGFTIFDKRLPYSIKLATKSDEQFGIGVITLGWGVTSLENKQKQIGSEHLNSLKVTLIEPNRCQQLLKFMKGRTFNVTTTLCAGNLEGGKDACQGDSGGPLFVQTKSKEDDKPSYTLFGLTSYGIGCGRKDVPGAYTRISNYLDFINKYVNDAPKLNNNNGNSNVDGLTNQELKLIKQIAGTDKIEIIKSEGKSLGNGIELFEVNSLPSKFQADITGNDAVQVDATVANAKFPEVKSTFQPRYF